MTHDAIRCDWCNDEIDAPNDDFITIDKHVLCSDGCGTTVKATIAVFSAVIDRVTADAGR